jgi:hypothetical protein
MFLVGFGAGALTVLLAFLLARARRDGLGAGDRILARLGSVGPRRSRGALRD